jgi:hypothetical protein
MVTNHEAGRAARCTRVQRSGLSAMFAAMLLAAVLAGCGGSSNNSSSSTSQASAQGTNASAPATAGTSTPASTPAPASTTSAAPASTTSAAAAPTAPATGATAKPGTALAPGQTATVGFDTTTKTGANGPSYKVAVTVLSIKKGSLKDFNGIQLNATEKASTPYYAKVKITNLSPKAFSTESDDPAISVEGVDTTGDTDTSVTFFGTFPPCNDVDTPNPFKPGQSVETCLTYLVPGGITKVAYTGTSAYETSPVTWAVK